MTMHRITKQERALSDGSLVYDVAIGPREGGDGGLVLPAVTEYDADRLISRLYDAILAHTNEDVRLAAQW
jgi:hypothetical protein